VSPSHNHPSSLPISVIVPTVGRKREVIWSLESLYTFGFIEGPEEFEVIVVEQPQEDSNYFFSEVEILNLKSKYHHLRWLRCTAANLPIARMVGLENSKGQFVLYLDDDILAGPGLVANHLKALESNGANAVVGRVIELNSQRNRKRKPKVNTLTGQLSGSWDLPEEARGRANTLIGCNMSFDSRVLREIGGFDPQFKYIALREEADVAERIKKQGGKIFYEPSAFLIHLKAPYGGCRHRTKEELAYWAKRSESIFLSKNFPQLTWVGLLCGNLLFYALFKTSLMKSAITGILDGRKSLQSEVNTINYDVYEM